MNEIRIVLRALAFGKSLCNSTVPYRRHVGVAMEGCRYGNREVRHGKRPDILANAGQCHRLSRLIIDRLQCTIRQEHVPAQVKFHINGLACLGTACGLAHIRTVVLTVELNGATLSVGQFAHIQAIA